MVKSSNASFIAQVPKKQRALELTDFGPINLIVSVYRIVSKLLAKKIKFVIGKLVSGEHNAFLKDRQLTNATLVLMKWLMGG